ncbi:MAG: cupin domain-containing protein [Firmicutes bacterium]|nr:cupin domain-containing protein [Bacillota bacterium]
MVRPSCDMQVEVREAMRGGKGRVQIMHVFKQEELKGKCRLFAKITLEPGCSIGLHEHVDEEEVFYIIKGRGRVVDGGVERDVAEGDAILTGDGASHSIENIGDEDLQLMAVILLY